MYTHTHIYIYKQLRLPTAPWMHKYEQVLSYGFLYSKKKTLLINLILLSRVIRN